MAIHHCVWHGLAGRLFSAGGFEHPPNRVNHQLRLFELHVVAALGGDPVRCVWQELRSHSGPWSSPLPPDVYRAVSNRPSIEPVVSFLRALCALASASGFCSATSSMSFWDSGGGQPTTGATNLSRP